VGGLALGGLVGLPNAGAAGVPSLSVGDLTAVEGDAGTAAIAVPVDLSAPTTVTVKVPYSVIVSSDGTADAADAQLKKGTLSFLAGVTTKSVSVMSVGDTVIEPDQHVLVVLGTPVGGTATVADGTGLVTLVDDDTNGVSKDIEVSIGEVTVTEADAGVHKASIPVLLSRPATVVTKVAFTLDCSSASALDDITIAKRGTITFQIGQRSKVITFTIGADVTPEQVEAASQSITSLLSTVKVLDNRGDATINDDDGALPANQGGRVPGFVTETLPSGSTFQQQNVGDIDQFTLTPSGAPSAQAYVDPEGGGYTDRPTSLSTSFDGRYVAFGSTKADLVAGDTNGLPDVFVRDRQTNTTERVSLRSDGAQITVADLPLHQASDMRVRPFLALSANGRYVAYDTTAAVDPGDASGNNWTQWVDVYLYDRQTHTSELVSVDSAGNPLHGSWGPAISANGRYVMFSGGPAGPEVYVRDRVLHTTTQIYNDFEGLDPALLSANGRFALIPSRGNGCLDEQLVVVDLTNGATERVDVTDDGVGALEEGPMWMLFHPSISADGRFVAFKSTAWNMIPGRTGPNAFHSGTYDISLLFAYVRDRENLSTTLLGMGADGSLPDPVDGSSQLTISGDGSLVAHANYQGRASLYDLTAGTKTTVGFPYGPDHVDTVFGPTSMSLDGRYLALASLDTILAGHIFVGDGYVQRLR
jgi:Tol biopolymer transport system component